MNDKLLNCPFCGGEAIKVAFTWECISDESTIECTICGARTKVLKAEDAIKHWNTRKPLERILAELEESKTNFEHMGTIQSAYYDKGLDKAINIVKGGVDNAG